MVVNAILSSLVGYGCARRCTSSRNLGKPGYGRAVLSDAQAALVRAETLDFRTRFGYLEPAWDLDIDPEL